MATEKRVTEVVEAVVVQAVVAEAVKSPALSSNFDLTLDEFCLRLSSEKVVPEMIAGFHYDQRINGVIKASQSNFKAAFDRFACQPA